MRAEIAHSEARCYGLEGKVDACASGKRGSTEERRFAHRCAYKNVVLQVLERTAQANHRAGQLCAGQQTATRAAHLAMVQTHIEGLTGISK